MPGKSSLWCALCFLVATACGTGDNRVDPADLELRDLLGVAPRTAALWNAEQRAAARRVLAGVLDEAGAPRSLALAPGSSADERVMRTLAALDIERSASGEGALGEVRVSLGTGGLVSTPRPAPTAVAAATGGKQAKPAIELVLAEGWSAEPVLAVLPGRGLDLLASFAFDAGHHAGPVVVAPAPRLAVIASYVEPTAGGAARLLVNPVALAALEPDPAEVAITMTGGSAPVERTAPSEPPAALVPAEPTALAAAGNPYSFYGSVAECAYAQRTRCERCLAASSCAPVTDSEDGNAECTTLGASGGRGYFLLCINLSLAITSVNECAADEAPSCPRDPTAASSLTSLEANARFLDDATCAPGLDTCLARIYGAPPQPFPGPAGLDAGVGGGGEPVDPPRATEVSCDDSCSSDNNNCEASPSCDTTGPSCNNSLSCDSSCSSSNGQSGCDDNCDSCSSDSSSGGSSGDGCGGDSSGGSSGDGCGDGCGGDSGSGSSGDGCGGDGCGGGGDSGGGDSGCGGAGGCSGSDSSGCGGSSGGGSNGCGAARRAPGRGFAIAFSVVWAFLPVPFAARARRRARKRKPDAETEVAR